MKKLTPHTRYIKNKRQYRFLSTLLDMGIIAVKDAGNITGAQNGRQIVMEVRNQGFRGLILTRCHHSLNQFGERIRPGEYYFAPGAEELAKEVIKEYVAKAAATAEARKAKLNSNNKKGG